MAVIHKKIFLTKEGNILVLSLVCKHFSKGSQRGIAAIGKISYKAVEGLVYPDGEGAVVGPRF